MYKKEDRSQGRHYHRMGPAGTPGRVRSKRQLLSPGRSPTIPDKCPDDKCFIRSMVDGAARSSKCIAGVHSTCACVCARAS